MTTQTTYDVQVTTKEIDGNATEKLENTLITNEGKKITIRDGYEEICQSCEGDGREWDKDIKDYIFIKCKSCNGHGKHEIIGGY